MVDGSWWAGDVVHRDGGAGARKKHTVDGSYSIRPHAAISFLELFAQPAMH
jgi:hypothetical protein